MIGAIIGDIAGSRFEWNNTKSKDFDLLHFRCAFTDDSVMTMAVAQALLDCAGAEDGLPAAVVVRMQEFGRKYPYAGYGRRFRAWLESVDPHPYESFGNGAAMRVSPVAYVAHSLEEARFLSDLVTSVTHNHPEGIKGAEAVTEAIYLALHGSTKGQIRKAIRERYYFVDFTLDEIRDSYEFDVSCAGSVPQAIVAFLESESFEDTLRNAVSIGGDSDTIAAIAGSIAEAYYGVPNSLRNSMHGFLDSFQLAVINAFEREYGIMTERSRADAPIEAERFVPAAVLSGNAIEQTERPVSIFETVLGLDDLPEMPVPKRKTSTKKRKKKDADVSLQADGIHAGKSRESVATESEQTEQKPTHTDEPLLWDTELLTSGERTESMPAVEDLFLSEAETVESSLEEKTTEVECRLEETKLARGSGAIKKRKKKQ